jgi:Lon protease-like protein
MSAGSSDADMSAKIAQLPTTLPIFPLTGVLLLPRGRLPLNIFEPRYLAMTRDALAADRMIGIIQPTERKLRSQPTERKLRDQLAEPKPRLTAAPPVFATGCAGRMTSFTEDGDRFLITLTGICRFDVVEELPITRGYRRVVPNWAPYYDDFREHDDVRIDRARLLASLRLFFKVHGISADWDAITETPDERLITSLAMICPFEPCEKQALLEADDLCERSRVLTALIEMAVIDPSTTDGDSVRH